MGREHPFMNDDDDIGQSRPLDTATELVLFHGMRSTPMTLCFHNSHERSPERDATVLASTLQTSLDPETFKMTAMLMYQMLQMKMQQQAAQMKMYGMSFGGGTIPYDDEKPEGLTEEDLNPPSDEV